MSSSGSKRARTEHTLESVKKRLLKLFEGTKPPEVTLEIDVANAFHGLGIPSELRSEAINALLKEKRVSLMSSRSGKANTQQIGYMVADAWVAKELRKLDQNHQAVYNYVVRQGSQGTWSAEVKKELHYSQQGNVNVYLKNLTDARLIRTVHCVNQVTKKVYIAHGIVASKALTGGPWYEDGHFDFEFVVELEELVLRNVFGVRDGRAMLSVTELRDYMNSLFKPEQEKLNCSEAQNLLDGLVALGHLEVVAPAVQRLRGMEPLRERVYSKVLEPLPERYQHFTSVPCGVCPHLNNECREGGIISPSSCPYMEDWIASQF